MILSLLILTLTDESLSLLNFRKAPGIDKGRGGYDQRCKFRSELYRLTVFGRTGPKIFLIGFPSGSEDTTIRSIPVVGNKRGIMPEENPKLEPRRSPESISGSKVIPFMVMPSSEVVIIFMVLLKEITAIATEKIICAMSSPTKRLNIVSCHLI